MDNAAVHLYYNCQTTESKHADAIAMILRHGHCSQEYGDTSKKKRIVSCDLKKLNV
jgi:hypothetical protein